MNKEFKIPPKSSRDLTSPEELAKKLSNLLGTRFKLTGKTRTDGSNIRKLVASTLEKTPLPTKAEESEYEIIPPKRKVLELLGYPNEEKKPLYGAFPDIRNQLLEVKVQDSPTVDLGKFSPEFEEIVIEDLNITTYDVRYLIALTNSETEIIEGIILSSGEKLGEVFSYVSDESYKCQRSIPIKFFDKYSGQSVFNPR